MIQQKKGSEALTSLTSSPQTLIEINSFDQLVVTKTYRGCVDLTADCCTSMNEVPQYEIKKEKKGDFIGILRSIVLCVTSH